MAWSPDGTKIAYVDLAVGGSRSADGYPHFAIVVANADGSHPHELSRGVNDRWHPWLTWSPDGTQIAFSSLVANDPSDGCIPGGDFMCPTDIYVMNVDGSGIRRITTDPAAEFQPAWSPDGTRIAFVRQMEASGSRTGVFVMDADGTHRMELAPTTDGTNYSPSWSPDGSQLVFSSTSAAAGIYIVNADGTGARPILTDRRYAGGAVWSPDGTTIAFVAAGGLLGGGGNSALDALYLMSPDGTGVTKLADEPGYGVSGGIAWQPLPAATQAPPEVSEVTGTIETVPRLSPFPDAVAIGEGGVWISAPRNDGSGGGDVVRLDPESAEVVARIPVEHLPGWETGGGGLAAGEGSVWSMGIDRVDGHLHTIVDRIDPSTNAVVEQIDLGPGSDGDVWASDGSLWAVRFTDVPNTLEVDRFDIGQDRVVARIAIPGEWSQEIFTYGDRVWVSALTTGSDGAFGGPGSKHLLIEIDAATDRYVGQTSCECGGLASSGPVMWAWVDRELHRYDAASGADLGPAAASPAPDSRLVADGEGGVWTVRADGDGARGEFDHIDASGQFVAAGAIGDDDGAMWGGVAVAFDPETQSLWFVHYKDSASVVRVRSR
jgi:hypothetical protein